MCGCLAGGEQVTLGLGPSRALPGLPKLVLPHAQVAGTMQRQDDGHGTHGALRRHVGGLNELGTSNI